MHLAAAVAMTVLERHLKVEVEGLQNRIQVEHLVHTLLATLKGLAIGHLKRGVTGMQTKQAQEGQHSMAIQVMQFKGCDTSALFHYVVITKYDAGTLVDLFAGATGRGGIRSVCMCNQES